MDFNNWKVIWSLLFGLLAFMITAGNILTIVVFLKQKLRKRPHFLLISLAVADLLVGLLPVPSYITFNELLHGGLRLERNFLFFYIYMYVHLFSGVASICSLAAISVERMYAIGWPFRHRLLNSKHYVFVIGLPWALAVVGVTPFLLNHLQLITSNIDIYTSMILFFVPLLIICGAYFVIWKKQKNRICTQIQTKRDVRLARTLFIVTVASIVTWLPYETYLVVFVFCSSSCISISFKGFLLIKLLLFSNSFVNVVIYPWRIPEFREAIREMLPLCKNSSRNRQDATSIEPWILRASRSQLHTLAQLESKV